MKPPLRFHTNAPSQIAPRHRARHVSAQLAVDASGKEHLLIHFYVESLQPDTASHANESPSLSFSDLSLDSVAEWTKIQAQNTFDSLKGTFAYLVGSPSTSTSKNNGTSPSTVPADAEKPPPEPSTGWGFAGLFGAIRGTSLPARKEERQWHTQHTSGEVHADLVKDEAGDFKYRYLLVDFPGEYRHHPYANVTRLRSQDVREAGSHT